MNELIGHKDDTFVLQGAAMASLGVGFLIYMGTMLALFTQYSTFSHSIEYWVPLLATSAILVLSILMLRKVRGRTGTDALQTRRTILELSYEKAGSPAKRSRKHKP